MNSRAGFPTYTLSRGASSANLSTPPNLKVYGRGGGIRTHVGLHPNGFQDRPVMTTSVPLDNLLITNKLYQCRYKVSI